MPNGLLLSHPASTAMPPFAIAHFLRRAAEGRYLRRAMEHIVATPFVIGAYASLPVETVDQETYYAELGTLPWCNGLEVPFKETLHDDVAWLAARMAESFTTNILTPIPGVMGRLGSNPAYGLASTDPDGRAAAFAHLTAANDAVRDFNDRLGHRFFTHVALHSAPKAAADKDAFAESLATVLEWDWDGAICVVEHCDAYNPELAPQKGFLTLDDELAVIAQFEGASTPIRASINWGRSAIEGRSADLPLEHITQASDSGLLAGLIFSGAHDRDNEYGPAWDDYHVAMNVDEPTSVMTPELVAAAIDAACPKTLDYLGAKATLAPRYSIPERLAILRNIAVAAGVTA